jgi:hypothetical protein
MNTIQIKLPSSCVFNCIAILSLALSAAQGQSEAALTNFNAPSFRNQTGSESALWNDSFTNASGGLNQAANTAPGGSAVADAAVVQTTPGAFLIGSPSGDIYSFSSTNIFVLNYSVSSPTAYSNGVGGVVFQAETAGSELDCSSIVLTYESCAGLQKLYATRNELYRDEEDTGFGPSSDVVSEWQWPSLPVDVTSFSIAFDGDDTSDALERANGDRQELGTANLPRLFIAAKSIGIPLVSWNCDLPRFGQPAGSGKRSAAQRRY